MKTPYEVPGEAVEKLAERYYGRMRVPFDERYANKDEELEASAAMGEARKQARADLELLAEKGLLAQNPSGGLASGSPTAQAQTTAGAPRQDLRPERK